MIKDNGSGSHIFILIDYKNVEKYSKYLCFREI